MSFSVTTSNWADVIARIPYGMEELCHYEIYVHPYEDESISICDRITVTVTSTKTGHPCNFAEAQSEFQRVLQEMKWGLM
jgi:hypothetical protein